MAVAAGVTAAAVAVFCVAVSGIGQQGTASGLRATAVLALPFLVGAYIAPALTMLWPGRLSQWLLARRRTFGLAFSACLQCISCWSHDFFLASRLTHRQGRSV
jgi:hypothetical protein